MPSAPSRRAALALALAAACGRTWAQKPVQMPAQSAPGWPRKPIKLVVGFPGGSSPDLVARTLADPLSTALGQPVIVENKVGAGGNMAADAVAKATDQHTLGVMINGNLTIAKVLNPRLGFDPLQDFTPISLIGTAPLALAVPMQAPGATAQEFLAAARAQGDRWSYGSPGVGTVAHLGMEWLMGLSGTPPVHVPYPGNPQVINALISGQIQLALLPPAMAAAQARAGRLRVIGITSSGRSALVPDYPSLAEAGVKNFHLEIWNALAGPRSLPPAVAARLSALVSEIVRSPEVRAKLFQQGWQTVGSSSEGLAHRIRSDAQGLGRVIAARGIRAE
ncbi:MAG: tripartite tricarboxylate transporter substrate-binding protein [Burkholderiaceae bacterium]|nr:tripartite tricarboxylate transporter substrate-binding protein [Burkholderiaceae bacterium]